MLFRSDMPVEELAGKIVLDTNNYMIWRDGHIPAIDSGEKTVHELRQEQLPTSKVAKAFNHIMAGDILTTGSPVGTPDRRALATASDHADAVKLATDLYDAFGFDTVDIGSVAESWRVERDQPAYVVRQNKTELGTNLARAER